MQMKKTRMLILCLLAALMCVMLAGCGSKEKTYVSGSQYVGTWNAVKITAAGKEVTAEEVFGGGFVLELKNDGTYTMTSGTEMEEGKWAETDNGPKVYGKDNKGAVYKVDGGTMQIDLIFAKVYLEKQ